MNVLQIVKLKLGISTDAKDEYFNMLIDTTKKEFEKMGITETEEDLIADYVLYKHRNEEKLSDNLRLRINNAKVHNASIR